MLISKSTKEQIESLRILLRSLQIFFARDAVVEALSDSTICANSLLHQDSSLGRKYIFDYFYKLLYMILISSKFFIIARFIRDKNIERS